MLGAIGWALRTGTRDRRIQVQWLAVVSLVIPVGLILVTARPASLGSIDFYHEGEGLAAARMMTRGLIPWKDYVSVTVPSTTGSPSSSASS